MERGLAAIEVLDEFDDPAGEAKLRIFVTALVLQRDLQAFVQKGQLAQALREEVVAEVNFLENADIGVKSDFCSGFARLAGDRELRFGNSAFVGLFPDLAVAQDFQVQPIGKRIDDGNAHTMQAARNFVGFAIEFSAGVQNGHDHFGSGLFLRGMHIHGNAAAVIDDGDAVVVMDDDIDLVAIAGQRFIHRVIYHLPNQVVQTLLGGRADIHRRTFAHGLEIAQHFDRGSVVPMTRSFAGHRLFLTHIVCVS